MRKIFSLLLILALVLVFSYPAKAGINDRFSDIELTEGEFIYFPQIPAPSGNPTDNTGWLYVKDNGGTTQLYFEDDAGGVTSWGGSTAWDDIGNPDLADTIDFTTFTATLTSAVTTGYSFNMTNTGDFNADEGVLKLQQSGGNPDGGELLYGTMVDPQVGGIEIYHSGDPASGALLGLDYAADDDAQSLYVLCRDNAAGDTVFQVAQGGDVTISETTFITEAILDFSAGPGEINTAAGNALTLSADDGGDANEDLIIIANNVALTAVGLMSFTPDVALDTAIDLTAANIDHGLKLADNDINFTTGTIEGTTASIDFTDFDVTDDGLIVIAPDDGVAAAGIDVDAGGALLTGIDLSDADITNAMDIGANAIISTGGVFATNAAGDITCNDVNATGTVTGATIAQNNIVPAGADPTPLGLDGTATGAVEIGLTSTGTIQLGADGAGATLVSLPNTVDLTMAGGQFSITDNQNADTFTLVNNTLTTQELMNISSTSLTDGKGIEIKLLGQEAGHALYIHNTDGTLTTGTYIYCYDDTDDVFTVSKEGAVYIMGDATGTAAITIDAGDIEMTDGHVEITTGNITTATGDITITTDGDIALTEGKITVDTNTATDLSSIIHSHNTDVAADAAIFTVSASDTDCAAEFYLQRLSFGADGDVHHNYLVLEDNGGDIFTIDAGGETAWALDDFNISIDADTVTQTGTAGVIGMIVKSATPNNSAIEIDYQLLDGGSNFQYGIIMSLDDDGVGAGDEKFVAFESIISAGTAAATTAFRSTDYDIALKTTSVAAGVIFDIDVADTYTAKGMDADLGPWIGTAGQGFIDITTDNANADCVGSIIRINMQDDDVDSNLTSGKAIYAKEVSPFKDGTFLTHFESTNNGSLVLIGEADISAAPLLGGSPLALEGATRDGTNILTITQTDPTTAKALNIPDSNVNMEIIGNIMVGLTTFTESAVATEVITEATVAIANGHAAAGQVYQWEIAGEKTGAANTYAIILVTDTATQMTLTASDAAAAEFVCRITLIMVDATNQLIYGELIEDGKVIVVDRVTATDDLSGAVNIGLSMTLANAGDEVKVYNTIVTYNE